MNKCEPQVLLKPTRLSIGSVIGVAMEHHLGAASCHCFDLHLGGGHGHHNHGPTAEPCGSKGHALGMVAGTGGDHPTLQFGGAEVGHGVVGPAQLEAEHRLQVFTFQQHRVAEAL